MTNLKALREALGLSQEGFANRFRLPIRSVMSWEQGKREPSRTTRVYLQMIEFDSEAVLDILDQMPEEVEDEQVSVIEKNAIELRRAESPSS